MKKDTLLEKKHTYLATGLGSFLPHYFLITSKEHEPAFSFLFQETDTINEYELLKKEITKYYKKNNITSWIEFEHGSSINDKGGCCVQHAHTHFIPNKSKILPIINKMIGKPRRIRCYDQLFKITNQGEYSYLFMEENNQKYLWLNPKIISQFMRRIIASSVGKEAEFDWRSHPYYENMDITNSCWKKII